MEEANMAVKAVKDVGPLQLGTPEIRTGPDGKTFEVWEEHGNVVAYWVGGVRYMRGLKVEDRRGFVHVEQSYNLAWKAGQEAGLPVRVEFESGYVTGA
jgi:hypothetical protein